MLEFGEFHFASFSAAVTDDVDDEDDINMSIM